MKLPACLMPAPMPAQPTTTPLRAAVGALACALLLAGCATPPAVPPKPAATTPAAPVNVPFTTPGGIPIDVSVTARGQDSRVMFLILHYTVLNLPDSIRVLTQQEVSSHYLVTDEASPRLMRLVDESQRAWHAGFSSWKGNRMLNASSIGIEIVHPGAKIGPSGEREYLPFPKSQIDALVPLVQDIVRRYQIKPERILGHAEIQPQTKQDPGPTFPWKLFSQLGITPPWPDAARVAAQRQVFEATPPDATWWQRTLVQHGYELGVTGQFDKATQNVIASFQMRYRPENYSGVADAETAALLHVLVTPPPAAPGAGTPAAGQAAPPAPASAPRAATPLPVR
jgi:N-acetylmuramoyl-L-alanine amidase